MHFAKSEISKMSFDELRRVKLHISKEQNKFSQGNERWDSAEKLRLYVESRENALEKQFIKDERKSGAEFRRCNSCLKDKPIKDHPFGFPFRTGKTSTICNRCKRDYNKVSHANNPEPGRDRSADHQERRKGLGKLSKKDRDFVRQLQKDNCAYCGIDLNEGGELDHFTPVERGGATTLDNCVFACTTCNRNKKTKMPEEFLKWRKLHKLPIRRGGFFEPYKPYNFEKSTLVISIQAMELCQRALILDAGDVDANSVHSYIMSRGLKKKSLSLPDKVYESYCHLVDKHKLHFIVNENGVQV